MRTNLHKETYDLFVFVWRIKPCLNIFPVRYRSSFRNYRVDWHFYFKILWANSSTLQEHKVKISKRIYKAMLETVENVVQILSKKILNKCYEAQIIKSK